MTTAEDGVDTAWPVARLLAPFDVVAPPVGAAGAAVSIVLRQGRAEVEVLLIERSRSPDDPASGQVALPGGRVDEIDRTLKATAERELEEEVGLAEGDLAGPLRFVGLQAAPRFSLTVGVFAGELGERSPGPGVRSPQEVAHVFWLPCSRLVTAEALRPTGLPDERAVPASRHDGHIVWGFTRRVLRDFFGLPREADGGGPVFAPSPTGTRGPAP